MLSSSKVVVSVQMSFFGTKFIYSIPYEIEAKLFV